MNDSAMALRAVLAENDRIRERLEAERAYLQAELGEVRDFREIVGQSAALRAALEKVRRVADTSAPVLLLGETGTGKELLARALHTHGPRRDGPFIAVNCAALPAALIESELFGHEKGAFTGASQAKPGRFELADRGTLLLDEIGELEPRPSGEAPPRPRGRRDPAARRDRDAQGRRARHRRHEPRPPPGHARGPLPRGPLLPAGRLPHRGAAPPGSPRGHPPPRLAFRRIAPAGARAARSRRFPRPRWPRLQAYDWPGNVRELQNVIERALILSPGSILRVDEVLGPGAVARDAGARSPDRVPPGRHAGPHRPGARAVPVDDRGTRTGGRAPRLEPEHPAEPDAEARHRAPGTVGAGERAPYPPGVTETENGGHDRVGTR